MYFGIEYTTGLEETLRQRADHIVEFASNWLREDVSREKHWPTPIVVFFLGYVLAGASQAA